jgi:signal peptidase I
MSWIFVTLMLVLAALLLFKVRVYSVKGQSMHPTINNGDVCIVWLTNNIQRGDIIVFHEGKNELIKRVIGLPGERIGVARQGVIIVSDKFTGPLPEPYILSLRPAKMGNRFIAHALGPDEYWVMGDNRQKSSDSRIFGPIKRNQITGKVLLIPWRRP